MKSFILLATLLLTTAIASATYTYPCGPNNCKYGEICHNMDNICRCLPYYQCHDVSLTFRKIGTWTTEDGKKYTQYDVDINNHNTSRNIKQIFIGTDSTLTLRGNDIWNVVKVGDTLALPSYQDINAGFLIGLIIGLSYSQINEPKYINLVPSVSCFNDTMEYIGYSTLIRGDGTSCLVNQMFQEFSYQFTPVGNLTNQWYLDTYEYHNCSGKLYDSQTITLEQCITIPKSLINSKFEFTITKKKPQILGGSVVFYLENNGSCSKDTITYFNDDFYNYQNQQQYLCQPIGKKSFVPVIYTCATGECRDIPITCGECFGFGL
ncbi:hypothetical protein DLAC_02519 [Tieghemostelium lacteum]|uniref:Carbohydrate binding domain-containing protein n=1 Tax=Tieghemostelium lacteum TaxID=361077 RepID=A0A152A2P4_TIELA|nr:hypothetical protein DLAC_02519 [Tieghemostelium lacteum]|eukprot:KYR00508.1 hypothetical protein DLAC_02519 [Tieghemostelium lacteum]